MKNIRANLCPPTGLGLFATNSIDFLLAFGFLDFPKFGPKKLHGNFAILSLIALSLAFDHNTSGEMFDTDGGTNFIDVLAAGTTRTAGFKFDIFISDFYFGFFGQER